MQLKEKMFYHQYLSVRAVLHQAFDLTHKAQFYGRTDCLPQRFCGGMLWFFSKPGVT
jgi:hypothetical protein